jgi:hypothetical protein
MYGFTPPKRVHFPEQEEHTIYGDSDTKLSPPGMDMVQKLVDTTMAWYENWVAPTEDAVFRRIITNLYTNAVATGMVIMPIITGYVLVFSKENPADMVMVDIHRGMVDGNSVTGWDELLELVGVSQ